MEKCGSAAGRRGGAGKGFGACPPERAALFDYIAPDVLGIPLWKKSSKKIALGMESLRAKMIRPDFLFRRDSKAAMWYNGSCQSTKQAGRFRRTRRKPAGRLGGEFEARRECRRRLILEMARLAAHARAAMRLAPGLLGKNGPGTAKCSVEIGAGKENFQWN